MWDGIDRRRFPRVHIPCRITIYSTESPRVFSTRTENIGCGGVCVILEKALKLFSLVGIELFLENGHQPVECSGRIVWVVGRKDARSFKPAFFDTGIEFVDIKEEDRKRIARLVEEVSKKE